LALPLEAILVSTNTSRSLVQQTPQVMTDQKRDNGSR
jgi:hypothetical protein